MELKYLCNLKQLTGSIFTGKEKNVRYKLLDILSTEVSKKTMCVVERDNRTKMGTTVKLTMSVSDFLNSVDKFEY